MGDNSLTVQSLVAAVRRLNLAAEERRDAEEKVREAVTRCLAAGTAIGIVAEALSGLRDAAQASILEPERGTADDRADGNPREAASAEPPIRPAPADGLYTLEQACEAGILPAANAGSVRARKSKAVRAGIPFPRGVKEGRTTRFTGVELADWWQRSGDLKKASAG
ncbi:hypothetical protein ACIQWA_36805 [Kitasatospora sp. NPDC098652]|uniref:hypothetical protein n=1 Tax=Kitasatospora sp. NPDC098652 TaxID=3364095 RepID=UPI003808530E